MAIDFGSGVSRTLSEVLRSFEYVVFQKKKPPLDSELNLLSQIHEGHIRDALQAAMPSGFLIDPTHALEDYQTASNWSNLFKLGRQKSGEKNPVLWVNVNGWLLPIAGTATAIADDTTNTIKLYPPPSSDLRVDFVFLEVWQTLVSPNPSTANKPAADQIWRYGNVEFGGTNIPDDLQDTQMGFETTKRVQVQSRLRVFGQGVGLGAGVALDIYPDGLGDPNVLGRGAATTPISGFTFLNMREELGDPSLWRAGDGNPNNNLGTVDGYTYAIPVCAIFRRNASTFVAVNTAGNANQNGAFNRTPSSAFLVNPLTGAKELTTVTLKNDLSATATGVVQVENLIGSGLDDPNHTLSNTFLLIEDEIVGVSSINTTSIPPTITIPTGGRGRNGTNAQAHAAATGISFYNVRPDGLFADEIADQDILDLRRSITYGEWDYQKLLAHNLSALSQNLMKSTFKKSGAGDTEGPSVVEVDYLLADGSTAVPNQTEALDGPDGIRTIFSDAAVIQPDVTLLCDNDAALTNGFTTSTFDANTEWDVGADFRPTGFINNAGATGSFKDGSTIFLHIGGATGSEGARATFRDGNTRAVRFLSPKEFWREETSTSLQQPVQIRFLDQPANNPAPLGGLASNHPGPMYPINNFEVPFIFLGGVLHPTLKVAGLSANTKLKNLPFEIDVGIDFDIPGNYFSMTGTSFNNDPTQVAFPLLRGQRTLYGMMTRDGADTSGLSSEVYVILYGDNISTANNGAFKVVGAGTVGYTQAVASNSTSLVLAPLDPAFANFNLTSTGTLQIEVRSQYTNAEDGDGSTTGPAAAALVLTDTKGAGGLNFNPWSNANLDAGFQFPDGIASKMVVDLSLLYHPGRGGLARVPVNLMRVAMCDPGDTYLRQAQSVLDATFASSSGAPLSEVAYDPNPIQVWNRLSSQGLDAPQAPAYGGTVVAGSEQDREHELFVDRGSKTVFFRPYQDKAMTLRKISTEANPNLLGGTTYPVGSVLNGIPRDGAGIWTDTKKWGFPVPPEYMPRFGRHDIPYRTYLTGGSPKFLSGINHLFTDKSDPTQPVFTVIGGEDNTTAGNLVKSMFYQTGTPGGYAQWGIIPAGPLNQPAYYARLTKDIGTGTPNATALTNRLKAVQSSDLGVGLRGIQLPPYQGIARLYGVYDRDDYISNAGRTFQSDRITVEANPATNLLRTDADQQTLYLFQDGAKDATGQSGDHTYIIPEQAIDITKSPNYTPGDTFDDFQYVVECVIFGFAQNWINQNNYVLVRKHTGAGVLIDEATPQVIELEGVGMTIPSPAEVNQPLYVAYNRIPYQGDPYMTRSGEVRTDSDYETRYGEIPVASAYQLVNPIQQIDSSGNVPIETPNDRAFEILASVDFYTTYGTGKMGGEVAPGTILDVGYKTATESVRLPSASNQPNWRSVPRAFTAGQGDNLTHAAIGLEFLHTSSTAVPHIPDNKLFFKVSWAGQTKTYVARENPTTALEFQIGESEPFTVTNNLDFPSIAADGSATIAVVVTGANPAAIPAQVVVVNAPALEDGLSVDGWVSAAGQVTVRVKNMTTGAIDPAAQTFTVKVFGVTYSREDDIIATARHFAQKIQVGIPEIYPQVNGRYVTLIAKAPGVIGNDYRLDVYTNDPDLLVSEYVRIIRPGNTELSAAQEGILFLQGSNFEGGRPYAANAASEVTPLDFIGMTERLPLGILFQDSDFLCEIVEGTAFEINPSTMAPLSFPQPLTTGGAEFSRFIGVPGELLGMADGGILKYTPYNDLSSPTGTKRFRLYRGGGSVFTLSGTTPGGPVSWLGEFLDPLPNLVLKGGILTGKAMLVRNFPESAFATNNTVSEGDEIQMVIITTGIIGRGNMSAEGMNTYGLISPTEYGKGISAADRYRLAGKPMVRRHSREVRDPATVVLALFGI